MELPKTRLMRYCGQFRSEPARGMSLRDLAAVLDEISLLLRTLREIIKREGVTNENLAFDITGGANDLRRISDELQRKAGDDGLSQMDLPDRTTPCVCPAAGFCERHGVDKPAHWHELCRTRKEYFEMWEAGKGPGQESVPAPVT